MHTQPDPVTTSLLPVLIDCQNKQSRTTSHPDQQQVPHKLNSGQLQHHQNRFNALRHTTNQQSMAAVTAANQTQSPFCRHLARSEVGLIHRQALPHDRVHFSLQPVLGFDMCQVAHKGQLVCISEPVLGRRTSQPVLRLDLCQVAQEHLLHPSRPIPGLRRRPSEPVLGLDLCQVAHERLVL